MRTAGALARLPLRVRLVGAFVAVMLLVLTAAGAFVYWRVELALDRTVNAEINAQSGTVRSAWQDRPDAASAAAALPAGGLGQVLDGSGQVLATSLAANGLSLLPASDVTLARRSRVVVTAGNVLTSGKKRLRVLAEPLPRAGGRAPAIAVVAVRLGPRDEALRELLAQLALANVLALAAVSVVGYRLARAALLPVERYRLQAEQIAAGATGVRLDVPARVDDEVSRLGHTLNRMLTVQERTSAQQRQFLADASHELRTPLTVLTTEVELALRRPRSAEEYEHTLQQVAVDAARLVTLAEQLLDLEQATGGSPAAAGAQVTDGSAAVERAAARSRVLLDGTGRAIAVQAAQPMTFVPLSATALDQVLTNLVANAAAHGEGTVTLMAATAQAGPSRFAVLTVSDTGTGPPDAFLPYAVERFRRADPARATPGNGLGLALVHALVSGGGGELRLCTARGHHRYPPLVGAEVDCAHPHEGTHATVVLPMAGAPTVGR